MLIFSLLSLLIRPFPVLLLPKYLQVPYSAFSCLSSSSSSESSRWDLLLDSSNRAQQQAAAVPLALAAASYCKGKALVLLPTFPQRDVSLRSQMEMTTLPSTSSLNHCASYDNKISCFA